MSATLAQRLINVPNVDPEIGGMEGGRSDWGSRQASYTSSQVLANLISDRRFPW